MSAQPSLSRELVWLKLAELNLDAALLTIHQVAFMDTPGVSPAEIDWLEATVVPDDTHPLWNPKIGQPALAVMVGPTRGDAAITNELADADYQVWVDASVDATGERIVRPAGIHSVNPMGTEAAA